MKILAAGVLTATMLVLSACGGSSDDSSAKPKATDTATTATATKPSKACSFLSAADRKTLATVALDTVVASDARGSGSSCRWSSDQALIQITSLPAKDWAKTLPDVVASLGKSTDVKSKKDKADLVRAQKLLKGASSFTSSQACAAFVTLAEINGAKTGEDTSITYLPISSEEIAISAQTCSGGVLTSVVYSKPGLVKGPTYEKRVRVAIEAAQKRALAG